MVLNFFRLGFGSDHYSIQRLPYSETELSRLRGLHNTKASFFKHEDWIYVSPASGSNIQLGEKTKLSLHEAHPVFESLIRHLLFRCFRERAPDRTLISFSPISFLSEKKEFDPMAEFVPLDVHSRIGYPRLLEIWVRSVVEAEKRVYGLLIQSRHRWRLDQTLAELSRDGFPLAGSTVLEAVPLPGLEGVLAPDETLLGEVLSVSNDETALIRTNEGELRRPLRELFLQRSQPQIAALLRHLLGDQQTDRVFERLRDYRTQARQPSVVYGHGYELAKWLAKSPVRNDDGFQFDLTVDSTVQATGFDLEPTRLIFDYTPGASATTPLSGLLRFGPYDSSRFDQKSPRILVLFQERNRGAVTNFLARLADGIPGARYFEKGFRDLFKLHTVDWVLKPIADAAPESYEAAIDIAIKENDGPAFGLALVECPEESHVFPDPDNPYLRAKVRLLGYGIPAQGVRDTHLRAAGATHENTLGPTALQMYAKLGGTPWVLPASHSVDHELVVGIGSTIQRPNLWSNAEQSRVVGLTTFFRGDGSYILGREVRGVAYSEYMETLLKSLESSLRYVSEEYWRPGNTVRIVFHVFKPMKNVEASVVEQLIRRFPDFQVLYAFVTISTEHPWIMLRSARQVGRNWRVENVDRGTNMILDDHSCLLQLKGSENRPNKSHRPPRPVVVRIHEASTYRDLHFICQQIHDFSYMSWRSFFPNEMPVTVFYSELIAQLTARFAKIKSWNPTVLDQHLRHRKWFL